MRYDSIPRYVNEAEDKYGKPQAPQEPPPLPVKATPFTWTEPSSIPLRQFIYGQHLIRKFLSTTVAPGGVGKSSLVIVEALAMASGKDLLGVQPKERSRVWLWNGEDPLEELQRRIMAAAKHYGLAREDFEGWLFVESAAQEGGRPNAGRALGYHRCPPRRLHPSRMPEPWLAVFQS